MARDYASGLSTIILAAGANERLKGIVPSHLKPLVLVNGIPLIQHAVNHSNSWGANQEIVVVSPQNVEFITQVVKQNRNIDWVVQPVAEGVMDALRRAMRVVHYNRFLLLCADNTFESTGDQPVTVLPLGFYMGLRDDLTDAQLRRFTRVTTVLDGGNEKVVLSSEGKFAWIGPVMGTSEQLEEYISAPSIQDFLASTGPYTALHMKCEDFGVPEAL